MSTHNDVRTSCAHIYRYQGGELCQWCGRPTHDPNWQEINEAQRRHRELNKGQNIRVWWSI